jgi:hypothetical protein
MKKVVMIVYDRNNRMKPLTESEYKRIITVEKMKEPQITERFKVTFRASGG